MNQFINNNNNSIKYFMHFIQFYSSLKPVKMNKVFLQMIQMN